MKRFVHILALLALLSTVFALPAGAQGEFPPVEDLGTFGAAPSGDGIVDETPEYWFVELSGTPAAAGGNVNNIRREQDTFRNEARRAGVQFTERFAYQTLWNGLSIAVPPGQVSRLATLGGVRGLYPVVTESLPDPVDGGSSPELITALGMTGADIAQSELGLTGAGVHVAVMDTGIDYDHPDLGGCFGPGCRVTVGFDFVGDAFNASDTAASIPVNPNPVPDPDPDDCQGHGTHVSGIVGASAASESGITGVAPGVTFGAYRVFGCDGNTFSDIMLAAMERIAADGADILNMSIGASFQWPQYPTAKAADKLVQKGIVVVASIGNSGANGLYSASAPGVGEHVIGVASFDNTHTHTSMFTISPDDTPFGYTNASGGQPPAPFEGTFPLARTGTATTGDDACAPLAPGSLDGHVVLIRRGTCPFHTKALNAQNAGAEAVVLYNNVAGTLNPTVAGIPPIEIPVVAISQADGELIDARLALGPVDLTWTDDVLTAPHPNAGLISSFSSYGLAPDLSLKPDIAAPGGAIRSTYPIEKGSYNTIGGTSMSSPHVAGAVALLLEARPNTPPMAVRGILQNSADPQLWWGNPGLGFLDNVHRQGAGMLDIDDAILATTRIEPSKLALGESEAGPAVRTLTIRNDGPAEVTYNLSHQPALATGPNTFTPGFFAGFAGVSFSSPSVTVPAGGSASVDVTITANPGLPDFSLYGGYIVVSGGGQTYRVPYAGLKGDYQSASVLFGNTFALPWLIRGNTLAQLGAGQTFTLEGNDVPALAVHLAHQSRRVRIEVRDANTGRNWHWVANLDYVGRSSTSGSVFLFAFDGTTFVGNGKKTFTVPDGQYVMTISVIKALGDENNPAHVESWTSPMFIIDRP